MEISARTAARVTPQAFLLTHYESLLFGLLVLVHLLPIWAFRYFPTTDGPAHLYNAWLAKTLLTNADHPLHQYLAFNPLPIPNYLSHGLLLGLLTVLPPWLADKVVLTLYIVGLPLAVRYLVRSWQPAAGFLAVLAFPFIYSAVFQYGFYNFCLSLVLLLVVLGYWRRHLYPAARPTAGAVAALAGWLLLLYFAHPLTYLVGGMVLGMMVLERAWNAPATLAARTTQPERLRTGLLSLAAACAPSLVLLVWYFKGQQSPAEPSVAAALPGPKQLLHDWLVLEPIRFMGSAEGTYRLLLASLLLGLVAYALWQQWRGQRRAAGTVWAVAAALMVLAYAFLPDALAGGSIIRPRLGLFSYLFLIGLLSTVPYPRRLQVGIIAAAALISVLLLGFRFGKYRTLATGLDEYRSAAQHLRPGSSVASLTYARVSRMPNGKNYDSYIDVFTHAAGYLGVERQLMSFENYEAATGYFPLQWRPDQTFLSDTEAAPATFNLTTYPQTHWPQYILLWGRQLQPVPSANARHVAPQLAQHYHATYRSPNGLLELFERNKTQRVAQGTP